MAARRHLPLSLVIVCLVLIRGYSPLPTTSRVAGPNPTRSPTPHEVSTEDSVPTLNDYSHYEDTDEYTETHTVPSTESPHRGTSDKCKYNPCLESQTPCAELAASSGCLCPGFTLHNQLPEAPKLKSVSWNGSEVVLHWCAPYSYVTGYKVRVVGKDRQTFGKDRRSGGVGHMDSLAEVCVVAVNDVGNSEASCLMYHPGDSSLPLKAGLIGGALGFLLLLLLAVLLWRHQRQRKQEASISMHDTAETRG
ncbi:leucine-rich repeat neuronal protein 4 [Etheostoma cragini]|uniref:leucine-rich repeat neuronal protein 4 n=1 Tax=Etheostoma cragini TaxID=417921 RepID=UPI00155E0C71|nr:leucine-rich repeat neuronal protein 4 [Etheostoma cragini]